ncbi:hypothetical protein J6590_044447 [Homalodisca vitripennis]|nr:hypothetical protein J6590_044447 [Homalodisca vitripennis]
MTLPCQNLRHFCITFSSDPGATLWGHTQNESPVSLRYAYSSLPHYLSKIFRYRLLSLNELRKTRNAFTESEDLFLSDKDKIVENIQVLTLSRHILIDKIQSLTCESEEALELINQLKWRNETSPTADPRRGHQWLRLRIFSQRTFSLI